MAEVWGFTPTDLYVETLSFPVIVSATSPQTVIVGRVTSTPIRSFKLRHSTVTTAEANSMASIYTACRGALIPFSFVDPNTNFAYQVRFDGSLRLEMFQPDLLRTNELTFIVVTS